MRHNPSQPTYLSGLISSHFFSLPRASPLPQLLLPKLRTVLCVTVILLFLYLWWTSSSLLILGSELSLDSFTISILWSLPELPKEMVEAVLSLGSYWTSNKCILLYLPYCNVHRLVYLPHYKWKLLGACKQYVYKKCLLNHLRFRNFSETWEYLQIFLKVSHKTVILFSY